MVDWFSFYKSAQLLTEDAKTTLRMFTEEQWCGQIPYSVKLSTLKMTVEQSYAMWLNWVETGEWNHV